MKPWTLLFFFASQALSAVDAVVDFGADPTGVSDSTAKIQAALDALDMAGGGTLHLPPGTYLVSGIDLGTGTTLLCDSGSGYYTGSGRVILTLKNTSNRSVINFKANAHNSRITGCSIEGNSGSQTMGSGIEASVGAYKNTIDHNSIDNTKQHGILLDGSNVAVGTFHIGPDNWFTNIGVHALNLKSAADSFIFSNYISTGSSGGHAINMTSSSSHNDVHENYMNQNGGNGINTDPSSNDNIFHNNRIRQNVYGGITDAGKNNIFQGNIIFDNGTGLHGPSNQVGAYLSGQNVIFSGNRLFDDGLQVQSYGIWSDVGSGVQTITGNDVSGNVLGGCNLTGSGLNVLWANNPGCF